MSDSLRSAATAKPPRSRFQVHTATRLMSAGVAFGTGLAFAGVVNVVSASGYRAVVALLLLVLGAVILIGSELVTVIGFSRQDRALIRDALQVANAAGGRCLPAKVVRARWQPAKRIATIMGVPARQAPAMVSVVWTVLPDQGPPRRAISVLPWNGPIEQVFATHSVHAVRATGDLDIVVWDQAGTADTRADAEGDPRWRTSRMPTNNALAGGYWLVVVIALAAVVAGWAVGTGICLL